MEKPRPEWVRLIRAEANQPLAPKNYMTTQDAIQLNPTNKEPVSFDHALSGIRDGNPRPVLSDQTQFPSEGARSAWHQKALAMLETLDLIRSHAFSTRLADKIKQIFVSDPDTRNPELAKRFLTQLHSFCGAVTEKDYADFLTDLIPSGEITEAVARSQRYSDSVAAHVQQLLGEIS